MDAISNPIQIALQDLERWDQRLVDLVRDERIDPWDIDLEKLSNLYLKELSDTLDYRIPARAVITSAVLLKLKADTMQWYEEPEVVFNQEPRYPMLDNPPVREPKRKITLVELVDALKDVMKPKRRRVRDYVEDTEPVLEVNPFDMNKYLEDVENKILKLVKEGSVVFSKIKEQFPFIFLAILFLAHDGKIELTQEGWNEEIQIEKA